MAGLILTKLKVLVVDDSENMRRLVKALLRSFGITQILEASEGAQAFELVQRLNPDLIVTDWRMEPVDGLALTRMLRQSERSPDPYIPVIMMTAYAERIRVLAARDAGVTEFLVKPLSAKSLYSRLRAVIEQPRDFVRVGQYFGPDRRRHRDNQYSGEERRGKLDQQRPAATPETELGQDDVNRLFTPTHVVESGPDGETRIKAVATQ